MRHAALWFAGNWPVADYLAHELEEVEEAIDAGNRDRYVPAYDALTASCNACKRPS